MATWSYSSVYQGAIVNGRFWVDFDLGVAAWYFSESTIDGSFLINETIDSSDLGSFSFEGYTADGNILIHGDKTEATAKGQLTLGPFEIKIPERFKEKIPELNTQEEYGARPVKRIIQNLCEDYLSDSILRGDIKENDSVNLKFKDGEIKIFKKKG